MRSITNLLADTVEPAHIKTTCIASRLIKSVAGALFQRWKKVRCMKRRHIDVPLSKNGIMDIQLAVRSFVPVPGLLLLDFARKMRIQAAIVSWYCCTFSHLACSKHIRLSMNLITRETSMVNASIQPSQRLMICREQAL